MTCGDVWANSPPLQHIARVPTPRLICSFFKERNFSGFLHSLFSVFRRDNEADFCRGTLEDLRIRNDMIIIIIIIISSPSIPFSS